MAVVLTTGSKLNSNNTAFESLSMSDANVVFAGVINAQNGEEIIIDNSYFGNNQATDIYSQSTKVNVNYTTFAGLYDSKDG